MSRSNLIKKIDTLVSKIVRERDAVCITCGTTETLTCGHFIGRSAMGTRFNLKNCNAQCVVCNSHLHGNLEIYKVEIDRKWGDGTADELTQIGNAITKLTINDLDKIYNDLKD